MRRALLLLLLAAPALAEPPICTAPTIKRSEKGFALTYADHDQNVQQTRNLCAAEVTDFPSPCEDGELLGSLDGEVICSSAGAGTVSSVALSVPSLFTLSGSPITTSGTFSLGLATQVANRVFAGPTTGADAVPAFRALVAADIPGLPYLATSTNYAASASPAGSALTVAANSVALGGDTTGNFIDSIACGLGITGCVAAGEAGTPTLAATLGTSISVAELANGTPGQLVTWAADGTATTVAVGTADQVLTSNGPDAAPSFKAPAADLSTTLILAPAGAGRNTVTPVGTGVDALTVNMPASSTAPAIEVKDNGTSRVKLLPSGIVEVDPAVGWQVRGNDGTGIMRCFNQGRSYCNFGANGMEVNFSGFSGSVPHWQWNIAGLFLSPTQNDRLPLTGALAQISNEDGTAGNVLLQLKGRSSQTGDALQVLSSADAVLVKIAMDGTVTALASALTPQAAPPVTCDAGRMGWSYADTSGADCFCNGTAWVNRIVLGTCS